MKKKLSTKFTVGFTLLALLICTCSSSVGYYKYKNTILEIYTQAAYNVANIATCYVDGDKIANYLVTRKTDEAYDAMTKELNNIKSSADISYLYIYVPTEEGLYYIFDATASDPDVPQMHLGTFSPYNSKLKDSVFHIFNTGERADQFFISKTEFGYNMTATTPIKNSNGDIVALLAVDIAMMLVESILFESTLVVCLVTTFFVVLFVFAYRKYLSKTVIGPINKVATCAASFVKSGAEVSDILKGINTDDEIETLAQSFIKMQSDIKDYVIHLTTVTAEKERISTELTIATQIQASMLPCIFPAFPNIKGFDIFASMHPAKEVGGDFYDFFLIDENHLAIVIADVSGKGVPAALFMVIAKTLIKNHAQAGNSPAEVFINTNGQLCENNDANMFVTAWMGVLELDTGKFIFANAGHNPPLLKKSGGQFEYLKSHSGFVLAGMEGIRYKQTETYLEVGDTLFLYTDGVTEATDADNKLYSELRLQNTLNSSEKFEPEYLLSTITNNINDFVKTAPQFDDITMLAIKINMINNPNSKDSSDTTFGNTKNISLAATIDEVQNAIEFTNTCLDEYGISLKIKWQMGIVVDEICSNIAKFAYQGTIGKMSISCDYNTETNCLQLIFMDTGTAYNPLDLPDPDITLSAEKRKIGGLGLLLVKNIVDNVVYEYKNTSNILAIEKYALLDNLRN